MNALQELLDLNWAYAQEILSAREEGIPEDAACMKDLLRMDAEFRKELEQLKQKAGEILSRYRL